MMRFYENIRKLYTPIGRTPIRGRDAMRRIRSVDSAAILVGDDGSIVSVGPESALDVNLPAGVERINCRGLVALPGFVDSHTHAVFYGERSTEFGMRAAGKTYQEIAESGGGIRSSVEHVRSATCEEIADYSKKYVSSALALGTTTMEVKSGYGLSVDAELKLLKAVRLLAEQTPMELHATFLGAHAFPANSERSKYVSEIISEQLPAVVRDNLAEFIDVFCDEGYFTNLETEEILRAGVRSGLKPRLHVDELADTGGAELAARLNCYSADHLLKVSRKGVEALATSSRTVATLLPTTALSLRVSYAPARALIDAGAIVAIATDCNPGTSMSENMQFVFTLAVIGMQISVEEALTAATLNGAAALGLEKSHGSLEPGKTCDVVFYDISQLDYLPYHIAVSDVVCVVKRGEFAAGEEL